jgi:uncharacterized protein (DUF433 family)
MGVAHGEIRNIIKGVREEYGPWPLTDAPLKTSTRVGAPKVLLEDDKGRHYDLGPTASYQTWLDPAALERVTNLLTHGGWVIKLHPDITRIEVNPERLSGRPTIRGRRIPADTIGQLGQDEAQIEVLKEDYDLDDSQIRDAVRWYEATQDFESVAA